MKSIGFIKFIILFVIVILIFISFVINFDKFTLSYNRKKAKHQNPYYITNDKRDIIQQINYLDSNSNIITDENTINEIKKGIKNNETIIQIVIQLTGITKEKISSYIDKLYMNKEIKKISNLSEIYGDIIYINTENFNLAFTLDFKNLAYKIDKVYSESYEYGWQYKEIVLDTKEKIYDKVKNDLKFINITNFEPDSMYIKYFAGIYADWDGEVFVVADNTNKITVEYEGDLQNNVSIKEGNSMVLKNDSEGYNQSENKIVSLTIGFDKQ